MSKAVRLFTVNIPLLLLYSVMGLGLLVVGCAFGIKSNICCPADGALFVTLGFVDPAL